MAEREYDAIVLGGGPGGYPCAIRLAQLKQKVVCVEEDEVGGVCLNWGCIPSKALISTAHLFTKAKSAEIQGLKFASAELDPNKLQDWKQSIVKKLTGGVRGLLKANGADVIDGRGRLTSANTVEVKTKDGKTEVLRAKKGIVIATGSATIQIPGFDFDGQRIIGAKEAVSLRQIPKRLLVVGGGVIGLELGMVYQAFGSQLTVVELTPNLLPGTDRDCVAVVERQLTKHGATIYKNTKAEGVDKRPDGSLSVRLVTEKGKQSVDCDVALVAVGMKPRSRDIGLEQVGVQIDQRGFVPTNDLCQTNVKGIYAVGDVSGAPMLAHKASKEGEICAEVVAGHRAGKDWVTVPSIIFTEPEIASVGITEQEAKDQKLDVKVGKFPFSALGRAMSIRETEGFIKIVTEKSSSRILGIHIVGPAASDLISEAALALEMVATAEDIALTIHPHPTLGEAMMEASMANLGHAVHIINR